MIQCWRLDCVQIERFHSQHSFRVHFDSHPFEMCVDVHCYCRLPIHTLERRSISMLHIAHPLPTTSWSLVGCCVCLFWFFLNHDCCRFSFRQVAQHHRILWPFISRKYVCNCWSNSKRRTLVTSTIVSERDLMCGWKVNKKKMISESVPLWCGPPLVSCLTFVRKRRQRKTERRERERGQVERRRCVSRRDGKTKQQTRCGWIRRKGERERWV